MNPIPIFFTGLITGGLTCLAVQGGLLATTISQREEENIKKGLNKTGGAVPIIVFLVSKLIAYTILGFLLGWFGSLFELSLSARIVIETLVIVFMLGTALNLLNVHPIFRYFVIQPPRFLFRIVRNRSKSADIFAPATLGAFTVFIPCGTTQAMMALAIGSGSPFTGALILFAFVLGTSPLFFTLGYLATRLGESLNQRFMKVAAVSIILLALYNTKGVLAVSGTEQVIREDLMNIYCTFTFCTTQNTGKVLAPVTQNATINIGPGGYSPNNLTIKAGSPFTLNLVNNGGGGCAQAFTIPKLGIQKIVPEGESARIEFTAPNKQGELQFMCSMGMYRGVINVI